MKKPTLCIAGKNEIATFGLKYLFHHYPDHKIIYIPNATDSGEHSWQPSLIKTAKQLNVGRVSLEDLYKIDDLIFFSLEYSELIKTNLFKSKSLFNIHFSKLPAYRGMYTSALPIINGEIESGVTLHLIDNGIDTGDVIDQLSFPILIDDTARDLYQNYTAHAIDLFQKNIDSIINNSFVAHPQPLAGSTYFAKSSIDYANLHIDFSKTAFDIHNQFRAFTFREYQMLEYKGWQIMRTVLTNTKSIKDPDSIVEETNSYFVVSSTDYDLKLFKDYYPILWQACEQDDMKAFENAALFIDDLNLKNKSGWTALIIAAYNGSYEIAKRLLQKGADVNAVSYTGTSPLICALNHFEKSNDEALFKLLCEAGADKSLVDHDGNTIHDYVQRRGLVGLLKFFASTSNNALV